MDKERVNGTINEILGAAKQKVGELTGDSGLQVEGAVQHLKGTAEIAWGKAKDAVREANEEAAAQRDKQVLVDDNEGK